MSQTVTQNQYHTITVKTRYNYTGNTSHFNPLRIQNAHSGFASEHFFLAVLKQPHVSHPSKFSHGGIFTCTPYIPDNSLVVSQLSQRPFSNLSFSITINLRRHFVLSSPLVWCLVSEIPPFLFNFVPPGIGNGHVKCGGQLTLRTAL
jgi:hypothetical protein